MDINWDKIDIKITIINDNDINPLNPYATLSQKERIEEIINVCSKIWTRVLNENNNKGTIKSDLQYGSSSQKISSSADKAI